MATGSTDLSEYTVGNKLVLDHDWSDPWGTGIDFTLVSDTTPVGDRLARLIGGGASTSLTWDPAPSSARVQMLALIRRTADEGAMFGVSGRVAGAVDTEYGVAGVLRNDPFDARTFVYNNGGTAFANETAHGLTVTDWTWIRVDLDGSAVKVRVWTDGGAEPGTWLIDATVSVTSSGKPGIHHDHISNNPQWDLAFFSYGTDGDTAPGPAAGEAHTRTIRSTTVGTLS